MSLSMYQASIPVIVHALNNLLGILKKGEAFATAKKIEPSVLVNARLAPDMFPLSRQVQIATDVVKGGAARLASAEIPSYADTESSFAELYERINKTIAFLNGFKAAQIDGTEDKAITLKVGGQDMEFKGQQYLLHFVLPNLFFHITTTYAILRHNGVDVGKKDFLGGV
ncbi:MAG: DUF1993 domain-containing protein [Alphaproteobacteria bacterium]|nr:DUF1993 domain-containing protein [Alphaproteobacteria bacterium]